MIWLRLLASVALLSIGSIASAGQLVVNGGFEASSSFGSSWTGSATTDGANGIVGTVDLISPYEGNRQASFLNTVSRTMTQTLLTTVNASETISFALADDAGTDGDSFKVYFGGTLLATFSNPGAGYMLHTYTVTATSASTDLSFTMVSPSGGWYLDAVAVNESAVGGPVPEPSTLALTCVACFSCLGHAYFRRRKARLAN